MALYFNKTHSFSFHNFSQIIFLLFFSLSCSELTKHKIESGKKTFASLEEFYLYGKKQVSDKSDNNSIDFLDTKSRKIKKISPKKVTHDKKQVNQNEDFDENINFFENLISEKTEEEYAYQIDNTREDKINKQASNFLEITNNTNLQIKIYSCRTSYPTCLCLYLGTYTLPIPCQKISLCDCYVDIVSRRASTANLAKLALEEYQDHIQKKITSLSKKYMELLKIIFSLKVGILSQITDNMLRNESVRNNKELVESVTKLTAMLYMTTTSRTYEKFLTEDCFKELFLKIMKNNYLEKTLHIKQIEDFLIDISTSGQEQRFTYPIHCGTFPQMSDKSEFAFKSSDEYHKFILFWSDTDEITFLNYGDKYIVIKKNAQDSLQKSYFYTTLKLNSNMENYFESPRINFFIFEDSSKIAQLQELKDFYEKQKNLLILAKFNEKWILMSYYTTQNK